MTVIPGREALLSDDDLMGILRACGLNGPMRITTIRARWKDGIDIDEPSHEVRRLADAIARRLASKPSDEVREALERACGVIKPFAKYEASAVFQIVYENAPPNLHVMRNADEHNITQITVADFRAAGAFIKDCALSTTEPKPS